MGNETTTTTTKIPQTMRAWVATRSGPVNDVLAFKTDHATPAPPKAGEIMIKVSHVSLNPGDIKMIAAKPMIFKKSALGGMDFAGEVVQLGPALAAAEQRTMRLGAIVAGTVPLSYILKGAGSLAEYLVVPAHAVVEKPDGLEESVAAALLGIVGQTSVCLWRASGLKKGDRALVNGASGGVGCVFTQVLHALGVHVTGVCSAKNEALVRRLGADEVIDYTAHENLYDHLSSLATSAGGKPFDAVFDCVGDPTLYLRSPGYLKADGKHLTIADGPFGLISQLKYNYWPSFLGGGRREYASIFSSPSGISAQGIVDWFQKGYIKEVPIASVFELKDTLKAFEMLATQRTVGKILIKVN